MLRYTDHKRNEASNFEEERENAAKKALRVASRSWVGDKDPW